MFKTVSLAVKCTPLCVEVSPFSFFVVLEYKLKDTEFTSVLAILLFCGKVPGSCHRQTETPPAVIFVVFVQKE